MTMLAEFKCECGTTVHVPEAFADQNIDCPVCRKIMTPTQVKPEPWWEDHQKGLEKMIGYGQTKSRKAELERYETAEANREHEGFEVQACEEGSEGFQVTETPIDGGSSRLEKRAFSVGWSRVSLLRLIMLLSLILLVFFVNGPNSHRTNRLGAMGEIRKMGPTHEELSTGQIQQTKGAERLVFEEIPARSLSVARFEREGFRIDSFTHEGEPKAKSRGLSPNGEAAERAQTEADALSLNAYAESPADGKTYTVNVGSFREKVRADRYVKKLRGKGFGAFEWEIELAQKGKWHRVSIGRFSTLEEAQVFAKDLSGKGFKTFVARFAVGQKSY